MPGLLLAIGMTALTALMKGAKQQQPSGYGSLPTIVDPGVWPAGMSASRRAGGASGAPRGDLWKSAGSFVTGGLPGLIGR